MLCFNSIVLREVATRFVALIHYLTTGQASQKKG